MSPAQIAAHMIIHATTNHRRKYVAKHVHCITSVHKLNGKLLHNILLMNAALVLHHIVLIFKLNEAIVTVIIEYIFYICEASVHKMSII